MNLKRLNSAEVRKLVERRLGKISNEIWEFAVEERMVGQYQQEQNLDWLIQKIRKLIALGAEKAHGYIECDRRQRRTQRIPSRQEAISSYVAMEARENTAVQQFRQTVLGGRILKIEEVEPWIVRQSEEHPYRHAVIVRLSAGITPDCDQDGSYTLSPPLPEISRFQGLAPVTFLEYPRAGSAWVQRIPAGPDGPLGALYKLSQSLAENYGWQRAQAIGFVLTDLTPEIPPYMVSFAGHDLGGLARIQIVVDPFFTPAEVAQMYKRIRSQFLTGKTKGLSEKHTRLAIQVLHQPKLDQSCLRNWNQQYPKWAYREMKRFKKEALAAHRRLEAMVRGWTVNPLKLVGS
ncbi:MAG: hypothetical protein ABSC05_36195 [Candidatus Solibacter sp.]